MRNISFAKFFSYDDETPNKTCRSKIEQITADLDSFSDGELIKQGLVKENPIDSVQIRTVERDDSEKE